MKKREEDYLNGNLTAMIDVVFQLIIFFVCTVNLQDKAIDDRIKLAMSPHGKAVKTKDPREINIDLDAQGHTTIARTYCSAQTLRNILRKAVQEYGQDVPVVIRGDGLARHLYIRKVMEACTDAGIYRIKFAALKEKA